MYVECNFSWTHGGHFFDPNSDEDQAKVEHWKSKGTNYYKNAISTWTVRDVLKRETAEKNHIAYKVLWSLREAAEWILGCPVVISRKGEISIKGVALDMSGNL